MLERDPDTRAVTRVQEQGARSRERILDAAEALMAERGYAGTSISAICKASGLPASSVYWHFESKEGLLHAVLERGFSRMIDEIRAAYDERGSPRERLQRMLRRAATVFEAQPREFQRLEIMITLERAHRDDTCRRTSDRFRQRLHALLEDALFEIFRSSDERVAREVAVEGARLAQILGDGATLTAIREPEDFDPSSLIEQLEIALLALGERRLEQRKAKEKRSS